MTNEPSRKNRGRMSLLTGASLFLFLVVYFNVRSPGPTEVVDWGVMSFGVLFLAYAVVMRIQGKE